MELVRRAQAGDREAFEMLVERHAAETYRLAAAIVGETDARDVAQESFVAAWQQLPRLRATAAFAPWLRRICVNRCRNWLRAGNRRGRPTSLQTDEAGRLPDRQRDFRGAVEARMVLEPGFEALSPDQRAVLALHYDGPFGMITLDRGHGVGGYPLVLDPSSSTHFFIEILATYELDQPPEGRDFGELDWRVENDLGSVVGELLNAFPPVRGRIGLGQWPGATVPEGRYSGWLLLAVPRDAADAELELVYQPAGVPDVTRIPVRSPGEAPAPLAAEWRYEEPLFVAQDGLPFTAIGSSEADALFVDADTYSPPRPATCIDSRPGGEPMETTDRTQDSIEQLEGRELPNPITDERVTLGEAGDALNPEGEAPEDDKDDAEGPAPHTTQMPR